MLKVLIVFSLVICLVIFLPTDASAYLTDLGTHPPPISGPYPYSPPGSWLPGQAGFPNIGQTYVDPVFGTTIRRISSNFPNKGDGIIYAKNSFTNADGTRIVATPNFRAIDTTTGATIRSLSTGGELSFDPVYPDIFYYYSGTTLRKISLSTGTNTVVKDFGINVAIHLGQTVDNIDNSGRYFVINLNGTARVWDAIDANGRLPGDPSYVPQAAGQMLATPGEAGHGGLFSGGITADFAGGYIGITPSADGAFKVIKTLYWYPLNLAAKTLDTTGYLRTPGWNGADHGDVVSASDGNSYFVGFNGSMPDVALMVWNISQGSSARILLHLGHNYTGGGASGISRGPLRDFMAVDLVYNSGGSTDLAAWEPFHQEIFLVNVLDSSVRRLAHHRCQYPVNAYTTEVRISANRDGTKFAWVSNYGYVSGEYSDTYVAELPTSPTSPTPTPNPASPTRTPTPTPTPIGVPGDANFDGKVDGLDYVIWRNNYNKQSQGTGFGDFNNSGFVDGLDYVIWRNNYNS